MFEVLQKLQFAVCTLGEDGRAERLHNLFHGHRLSCELIFRGAEQPLEYPLRLQHLLPVSLTTRARRLPCPPAADPYTWRCHQLRCFSRHTGRPNSSIAIPARNLEGGAKDLSTHELRHIAGSVVSSHL